MPPLPYSDCTSKNPATCRYHGALLRMELAAVAGDLDMYMSARVEVEKACRDRERSSWDEHRVMPSAMWGKTSSGYKERVGFLRSTKSVPTPLPVYALWATLFQEQGGELKERTDRLFNHPARPSYENLEWFHWTPTEGGVPIPELFGNTSMELLVVPKMLRRPLPKPAQKTAPGWEWGRNVVKVIHPTTDDYYRVSCNQSTCWTYPDVEEYRSKRTVDQMIDEVSHQRKANRNSY